MPSITEVDNIKSLDDTGQTSILTKTGTGENKVFTADNVTLGSSVVFPAGHILQVKLGQTSTQVPLNTANLTPIGLSVDITPSSPTNKILVTANVQHQLPANNGFQFVLYRDATVIVTTTDYHAYTQTGQTNGTVTHIFLDDISDSPAWSSGVITYSVSVKRYSDSGTVYITEEGSNSSEIIAMEVVA